MTDRTSRKYPQNEDSAPVYYVDDYDSDTEWSEPELYSNSSLASGSAETLASSQVHDYFREEHGRMFPADDGVAISMPIGSAEVERCVEQHKTLKALFGTNYWGPVDRVLAPVPGQTSRKRVLDMMTADGSWAQEMSRQFPHVDFLSVDNVPMTAHAPRANVEFEVYDLYNGIANPDATFDMVHIRHAMMHLKSPKKLIKDIYRVLKPGGLLLFADTELDAFDGRNLEHSAADTLPMLHEGFRILRGALTHQGVDVCMWRDLPSWLSPGSDLWPRRKLTEQNKPVGFRNIRSKVHIIPAGPWPDDERLRAIGWSAGRTWQRIWTSMEAPLQLFGLEAGRAKEVAQGAVEEIGTGNIAVAAKYHTIYAFKI